MNRVKEAPIPHPLRFVTSAVDLQGCPSETLPEVAIVGRSNAGKSSVINGWSGSSIAKVSSSPGKTRLLNFFESRQYRLVDMPGYGFASRSGDEQRDWQGMIEEYLSQRESLIGLLIVMDIRREWTKDEDDLVRWISPRELPIALILSKADKLSRSQALNRADKIQTASSIENVFMTSALKKTGFNELEEFVFQEWVKCVL